VTLLFRVTFPRKLRKLAYIFLVLAMPGVGERRSLKTSSSLYKPTEKVGIDLRSMKRKRSKLKAVREDRPMGLSRRESQVVELMGKGLSRAEISNRLGVSRKCVSVFIERARGKFRLKTSLQLRLLAFRMAVFADKRTR